MAMSMSGVLSNTGVSTPPPQPVLAQAFNPDEFADIPQRLNVTVVPAQGTGKSGIRPAYEQVNPEYSQYAFIQPATKERDAKVLGYRIPTGKTFQGKPLIAEYDAKGNFQYAAFTPDQYLTPDPSRPNIIAQPKFNKTGGIVDYGTFDRNNNSGGGGFGDFLSGFVEDFGPMILAGLGANYLPGLLGGGSAAAGPAGYGCPPGTSPGSRRHAAPRTR
jgi:hypothetical protein